MKKRINLDDFIGFCREKMKIEMTESEWNFVRRKRQVLEHLSAERPVYGFNTGVGPFFQEHVEVESQAEFQENLLLRHAAGVGEFLPAEEARGMMFLLINMLRKGYSGVSVKTLEHIIDTFNRNLIPAIPDQGSVGASGDLAPQAHLALFFVGKGRPLVERSSAFGYVPNPVYRHQLKSGEALALINGTHFMTSLLALTVYRSDVLAKTADIATALTFAALKGNKDALNKRLHRLRLHAEQRRSAENIGLLLRGIDYSCATLQDAYSLRCTAQVHGPVKETISHARRAVEKEINSVTGNPVLIGRELIHGGNFHGQILSMTADFMAISLTTLGNISERRTDRLLNGSLRGLPQFLSRKPGLDSGLMIAQYTAADLCAENKVLSHPASVDSIPLAGGQEDFVSMGAGAVRKLRKIYGNTVKVLAIELLCGLEAFDARKSGENGTSFLGQIINELKQHFVFNPKLPLAKAINDMADLIERGIVLEEAEKITGPLA